MTLLTEDLNSTHHNQDDEDQQKQPHAAARVVAPACAIGPSRKASQQEQDQQDQQDGSNHNFTLARQSYRRPSNLPSVLGGISWEMMAQAEAVPRKTAE